MPHATDEKCDSENETGITNLGICIIKGEGKPALFDEGSMTSIL